VSSEDVGKLSPERSRSLVGYALVLTATAIWSGNFIVARVLAGSVPPVTLAFLRWATAVLVLLPFGIRPMYRDRKVILSHLGYLSLSAFLVVTVFNTLIYIAAYTSKAINLSLIAISSPIFIVLLARIFLKDRFSLKRIVGLIAATSGVILLITNGEMSRLTGLAFSRGDLWMLVAAMIFGAYSILARIKPAALSPVAFLCSTFILGLLFLVPWVLWELKDVKDIHFSSTAVAAIVYLGIGPSLSAFLCWNRAITLIGPVRAAFAYYSLPVFSGAEALVLLGEPVSAIHVVSGIMILLGIIVATRESKI
jgi:drug/metabolite transporter (DMT)-like permease